MSSFIEQIAVSGRATGQRRRTALLSLPTKDARDELISLLASTWSTFTHVEKIAGTLLGDIGLELARVDRISLDVSPTTDQRRHQGADRVVHFAYGADLVRNIEGIWKRIQPL